MEMAGLALFELSLIGAVFATAKQKEIKVFVCIAAAFWFFANLSGLRDSSYAGALALLSATIVIGSLVATFSNLLSNRDHDLNHLLGVVFGYFLVAMAWAIFFSQIERWQPGSFEIPSKQNLSASFVYFSLITVTTLGYGDILPLSPLARLCAAFEAAIGVLYIAVMIGSIVGSFRSSDAIKDQHKDQS
jgi:voltage-gated potassium channel